MKISEDWGYIVFIILFSALIFGVTYAIPKMACEKYAALNKVVYNYSYVNGCLIKMNGVYIERENIREVLR